MHSCLRTQILTFLLLFALIFARVGSCSDSKLDFGKHIYPLLKDHCIACHNSAQKKGELNMESLEGLLKGGESGPAIIKGSGDKSLLWRSAAGKEETLMPPPKNKAGATPLNKEQLDLVKRWIDQGAQGSTIVEKSEPVHWKTLPRAFIPIDAVALSADGQTAACNRGNQLFVYALASGAQTKLIDPQLGNSADRDLIMALAFSPDGTTLASGGYRCVRIWKKQPLAPLATLDCGSADSLAAAVSPDGKWIATGGANNTIKVWDASNGTLSREISGHKAIVKSLAFSPDSSRIVSASFDKVLRVSNVSGEEIKSLTSPAEVIAVAWTGDGKRIAAICADVFVRVWTIPESGDWAAPKEIKGHNGAVTALCAIPNSKTLVSGGADGTIRYIDSEAGNEMRKLDHGAPVVSVAARADGKSCASAGGNFAKVWKIENGENTATLKGDRRASDALADAERSAAFSKDQVAYHKNITTEAEKTLSAETDNAKKAAEKVQSVVKEFTAKQEAAKKAQEAKAEVEKTATGPLQELKKASDDKDALEKTATAIAKDVKAANDKVAQAKGAVAKATEAKAAADKAVAGLNPKSKPADVKSAKDKADAAKAALDQATAAQAAAEKAAAEIAPKAKSAEDAKAAAQKTFTDLSEKHKDVQAKFKAAEKALADANQALKQAEQAKSAAEQNAERCAGVQKKCEANVATAKAALANAEAEQKTADAVLETAKKAAAEGEKPIRAVAFSPDNRILTSGADDGVIHTWSLDTGRGGEQYRDKAESVAALAFLPDGRIVSRTKGTNAYIWPKAAEWKLEKALGSGDENSPIVDRVLSLTFSSDGKWLVSGGGVPARTGEVKIWNTADWSLAKEMNDAHSDTVFGLAFTRDNKRLATCAADKLIKVFDPATGKLLKVWEGHTQHVLSVSWKRDGRTLVSSGADKTAKLWDWVTGEQTKTIEGFKKEVTSAVYLDVSGDILLACGDSQFRTSKEDGNKTRSFQAGKDYIQSAAATRDGKLVICGGNDSVLRVFDSSKDKILLSFDAPKDEGAVADVPEAKKKK